MPQKSEEDILKVRVKELQNHNRDLVVANNRLVEDNRYLKARISTLEKARENMYLEKELAARGYSTVLKEMKEKIEKIKEAMEED